MCALVLVKGLKALAVDKNKQQQTTATPTASRRQEVVGCGSEKWGVCFGRNGSAWHRCAPKTATHGMLGGGRARATEDLNVRVRVWEATAIPSLEIIRRAARNVNTEAT